MPPGATQPEEMPDVTSNSSQLPRTANVRNARTSRDIPAIRMINMEVTYDLQPKRQTRGRCAVQTQRTGGIRHAIQGSAIDKAQ